MFVRTRCLINQSLKTGGRWPPLRVCANRVRWGGVHRWSYKSLLLWVTKWHEGLRKQHSVLFFPECDRAAARQGGGPCSARWMRSFLKVCNYSSVCSPIFNLRTLCTLLASTFSRKRRLCFEQILTPIYKNWFTFRTDSHGAPLLVCANKVR